MDVFLKTGKVGSGSRGVGKKEVGVGPSKTIKSVPWVEKYRPKTLEDVAAHKDIVDTGKEETKNTTFPSIVLEEITPYRN